MREKQGKQDKSKSKRKVPPKVVDPKLEKVVLFDLKRRKKEE